MCLILLEFSSLKDYVSTTKNSLGHIKCPTRCVHCGYHKVHRHGTRTRQCDRKSPSTESLNPVLIQRFRCVSCRRTFSALPMCIPPRRWYPWETQQNVLDAHLKDKSFRHIAKLFGIARSTVSRWVKSFKDKFSLHADQLKGTMLGRLKHASDFSTFWETCLSNFSLAKIMYRLHIAGIEIP